MKNLILIGAALVLAACQGQNPFKRQSNPVRNYPNVNKSIEEKKNLVPYGTKFDPVEDADNSQKVCSFPFSVFVEGGEGDRLMSFTAGAESVYEIKIRNNMARNTDFTVTANPLPAGAKFALKAKDQAVAVYQLTWKPESPANGRYVLVLKFDSDDLKKTCDNAIATERLNLIVENNKEKPTVEAIGVPQVPVVYNKANDVYFTVVVHDRAGSPTAPLAPKLLPAEFRRSAQNAERDVYDGSKLVTCVWNTPMHLGDNKWQFQCRFHISNMDPSSELINSGRKITAVFFLTAISDSNKQYSDPIPVHIMVEFKPAAPASVEGVEI